MSIESDLREARDRLAILERKVMTGGRENGFVAPSSVDWTILPNTSNIAVGKWVNRLGTAMTTATLTGDHTDEIGVVVGSMPDGRAIVVFHGDCEIKDATYTPGSVYYLAGSISGALPWNVSTTPTLRPLFLALTATKIYVIARTQSRTPVVLTVGSGNEIYNVGGVVIDGLIGSAICTGTPTRVPASLTTAYSDGLTAAYITGTLDLVWLASRTQLSGSDPVLSDGVYTVPYGKPVLARRSGTVICAADGLPVSVYLVWTP